MSRPKSLFRIQRKIRYVTTYDVTQGSSAIVRKVLRKRTCWLPSSASPKPPTKVSATEQAVNVNETRALLQNLGSVNTSM